MNLSLYNQKVINEYKSNSQIARVLTERWVLKNLFCPRCLNLHLNQFPNNNPVVDFSCLRCSEIYQLKSQKNKFSRKITDGAYQVMINSINKNFRPTFLLLKYDTDYLIEDLFLIPSFFFTESIIEKRKPLNVDARRAGWIGCNILLERIPPEGKIIIIKDSKLFNKETISNQLRKVDFIKKYPLNERGWTIDILRILHSLNKNEFSLNEVYNHEEELSKEHPNNHHIKDKIRQQLQILRDKKLLYFKGRGLYQLKQD